MSDNAKTIRPLLILALLLTAAAAPAAELPDPAALTLERVAAQFANTRFELRAELQAPRPASAQPQPQSVGPVVAATPSAPRVAANF